MGRVRRGALVALAAASAALSGCGGTKLTLTATNSTTIGNAGVVEIYAVHETEFKLTPDTFSAPGQGNYAFKAINDGKLKHAIALQGPGIYTVTAKIAPSHSLTFTVQLRSAGKYTLFDPTDGYRAKGMHAVVQVP
jgi:hypothetical protein